MRITVSRNARALLASLLVLSLVAACGGNESQPNVAQVRVGAPTGPNAAVYFMARGYDEDDVLVSASTDVAGSVEFHETTTNDDGTMTMQPLPSFSLPAGGELILEPGGRHLMLIGVDDLEVGDTIDVTLTWQNAGDMTVEAVVVDPADTMGDG